MPCPVHGLYYSSGPWYPVRYRKPDGPSVFLSFSLFCLRRRPSFSVARPPPFIANQAASRQRQSHIRNAYLLTDWQPPSVPPPRATVLPSVHPSCVVRIQKPPLYFAQRKPFHHPLARSCADTSFVSGRIRERKRKEEHLKRC